MEDSAFYRDQKIIQSLLNWDDKVEVIGGKFSTNLDDYASSSSDDEDVGPTNTCDDEDDHRETTNDTEGKISKKKIQDMLDMECTIFDKLLESLQDKANLNQEKEDDSPEPCTASLENETLTVQDKLSIVSFSITKSILQQWEEEMQEKQAKENSNQDSSESNNNEVPINLKDDSKTMLQSVDTFLKPPEYVEE